MNEDNVHSPYDPPGHYTRKPANLRLPIRVITGMLTFLVAGGSSLYFSRSHMDGYKAITGLIFPDGGLQMLDDQRSAGIPPWLEYSVYKKSYAGRPAEYRKEYTGVAVQNLLVNILWCALAAVVAQRWLLRRK